MLPRAVFGFLLLAGLAVSPARAERLPGPVEAEVLEVIDGDTLRVSARIWLGQSLVVLVRLRGIDAPERRSRCAAEKARAREAAEVLARGVGDAPVILSDIGRDKYFGRVLADVHSGTGTALGPLMLASGLARPYAGGRRQPWCEAEAAAR